MFKKSFGKKVLEKLSLSVLVGLFGLVSFGGWALAPVKVAAVDACNDIRFDVRDSTGRWLTTPGSVISVPGDATISFRVNVNKSCNTDHVNVEYFPNKNNSLITLSKELANILPGASYVAYSRNWQVSGFGVQPGESIQFRARVWPKGVTDETGTSTSGTVNLKITEKGTDSVPNPGPGSNGNNSGSGGSGNSGVGGSNQISTPVVGTIDSPISIKSLGELITTGIKYLLGFLATLSVLFIIIGGVRMVVSGGSEGEVKAGKQTVTWAVVGMVVSLLAFTIINVVQSLLKVK